MCNRRAFPMDAESLADELKSIAQRDEQLKRIATKGEPSAVAYAASLNDLRYGSIRESLSKMLGMSAASLDAKRKRVTR